MHRVQFQLTDEQLAGLRRRAEETGRSVSDLGREAIDTWLAREDLEARIARAMAVAGIGHSGLGDVAENHDKYLNEGDRW